MNQGELVEYFEHLRYQIVCFPSDGSSVLPKSIGSGFMLDYNGHTFFMTADHVVNTHNNGVRHIETRNVYISTNQIAWTPQGQWNTVLIPVADFMYFNEFRVDEQTGDITTCPLFDGTFSMLKEWQVNAVYVTCEVKEYGANVNMGERKVHMLDSSISSPRVDAEYCVFGRVRPNFQLDNNVQVLNTQKIFHDGLKFEREEDNYYVLKCPYPVVVADWKGLSGSAVIDHEGALIGIACKVSSFTDEIWVKKIQRMMPLLDAAILSKTISA